MSRDRPLQTGDATETGLGERRGGGLRVGERLRLRTAAGTLSPFWTREPVRSQCLQAFFEVLPVRSPVRNRAVGAESVQGLSSSVKSTLLRQKKSVVEGKSVDVGG